MEHCKHEIEIQKMKIDIAVAQSDISKVTNDIHDIKQNMTKFNWWLIGIMSTSIITLLTILGRG